MIVCPNCAAENPDTARFCHACGSALEAPAAPVREERKVVTVLFADLVGFTARAEQLDPEDVRGLLAPYHAHLREELERFGGTVEKFIGDAVVALFGAPTAHEDDPERAVRAALAIRDWAREQDGLEVRIAVTTGESLVTLDAQPERGEGMVAGDVVNTAARLQAAAPANGILVGETTYRATRDRIEHRSAEPVEAKGKADRIPAWEALDLRSGAPLDREVLAPLMGRERELRLVTELLDRVRAERSPQLVTLVGAPGIGKSRLVYELFQHVAEQKEAVTWLQGRSLSYGEGGSLWALAEIVKSRVGALETHSAADVASKIGAAVADVLGGDSWVQGHLAALLGTGTEEKLQTERDDAFAAWRRFFEAVADERPLVLVFDDLQWADDALLDFVEHLVDWASGVPILVVATARPEVLERRPGWGGGKLNATTLALSPLTEVDSARLIGALLEQTLLAAETQSALLDRIGGNPLYAEQYALLYRERESASELPLPEGVQGIIAARLDLLSAEEKQVLQDAAVVGKVFWPGAIGLNGAAVAQKLHALERKDFVRRERRSSVAGEDEYAFQHLLVRDVAYAQIPRAVRAERHRLTAAWIESLGADRDDHAELLADHYVRALELARAVGDVRSDDVRRAGDALRRAADHSFRVAAFERAAPLYEHALALTPEDERPRLLLAYGTALQRLEDARAEQVLSEARDALAARGDVEGAGEAEATVTEVLWTRGDGIRAAEHAQRAVDLLRDSSSSFAKAYALSNLARIQTFTGRAEEAVATATSAVTIAADLGFDEMLAHALDTLGTAKVLLGDTSGIDDLERAVELALAANSPEAMRAYNNLGGSLMYLGEIARAQKAYDDGVRVAERFGNRRWVEQMGDRRVFLVFEGKWDALLGQLKEWSQPDETRAFVLLARNELEAADRESARTLEAARRSGRADELGLNLTLRMQVLEAQGERAAAARLLDEVVALLPDFAPWLGQFYVAVAIVDAGRDDAVSAALATAPRTPAAHAVRLYAAGDFSAAAAAFSAQGDRLSEARARVRAAEKLIAAGRRAEADRELERALGFFRKAGATVFIREAEALLRESA